MPDTVIQALNIERPGVYVHIDQVVDQLNSWAVEYNSEDLREAAVAFKVAFIVGNELPLEEPPDVIERVEIFPDLDGKWHARPVTNDGSILLVTEGDFNRDFVEQDATTRWPGKELFEVPDALSDSIWDEQATTFGFNGRRRPSPKRLWS